MKKLLIIGIVALMIQSLGAVTLPSSSYSPIPSSASSSKGGVVTSSGTMVKGSYSMLREGGAAPTEDCGTSCSVYLVSDCFQCFGMGEPDEECMKTNCSSYVSCVAECEKALGQDDTPLDGGLGILLVLSVLTGAVSLYKSRRNKLLNK